MIRLNCFFQANDGEQYKTALQAAIALTELSQKHEGIDSTSKCNTVVQR